MFVTTIALVVYAAGLPVLWYHKYCTVLDVFEKPGLYNSAPLYVAFSATRLVAAWGSVAAIWSLIGPLPGLAAGILYFLTGTVALRLYYDRQVAKWLAVFTKQIAKERSLPAGAPLSPELAKDALALARSQVNKAMKGQMT